MELVLGSNRIMDTSVLTNNGKPLVSIEQAENGEVLVDVIKSPLLSR